MSPPWTAATWPAAWWPCGQGLLELRDPRGEELAARIRALYMAVDLTPLYNKRRALFHIGLDPDTGEASPSYYDLLMSESRMTGYFALPPAG